MNERGESYGRVVPEKPPNKAARVAAEVVEERRPVKGNTVSKTCAGPRAGGSTPSELACVRQVAERDKDARFTALLHHVSVELLRDAFGALRPKAAAGVDGVTWHAYEQ